MNVDIDIIPRDSVPRWVSVGAPLFSILAALLAGSIVLLAVQVNPLQAYFQILGSPLLSPDGHVSVLVKLVPLFLTGVAVYLPLKAGLWNIGADGQLYIGAIFATWIGLSVSAPMLVIVPVMFLIGGLTGGVWGFIPGYLRAKWNVNEIIVSLLMTFIAIQLNEFVIQGPLQAQQGFPSSAQLPDAALLPTVGAIVAGPWSSLHIGILVVPTVAIIIYTVMRHSPIGYNIRLMGNSEEAARQAGKSKLKIFALTMGIGGVLAGMAGMIEIAGVQRNLQSHFSPGYGFTAIPIALLGRNGILQLALASLLFALMFVGSTTASTSLGVDRSILDVIQALIILFLITAEFFKRYTIDVDISRADSTASESRTDQFTGEVDQ